MKTLRAAALACLSVGLFAGCESDEGNENYGNGGRKVAEIVGTVNYASYGDYPASSSTQRFQFFYDDEGRLDRWVYTGSNSSSDLEFHYESATHIRIFGTDQDGSYTESIVAEIDLNAAGKVARITDLDNHDQTYYYSNGPLSRSVDERGHTISYNWTGGDLTSIRVDPNPISTSAGDYIETAQYNTMPNIANLDLNHFAYGTEYYCCMFFDGNIGELLGMTGLFGRNSHLVTKNSLSDDRIIEWTFDEAGYPVGLHRVDYYQSQVEYEASYTIYYNE